MTTNPVTKNSPAAPPGTAAPEEYISKQELAARLKKTVRTVENWQRRGILPYVKCGHSVLFNWPDVQAYLHSHFRVCRKPMQRTPRRKLYRIPCISTGPTERKTQC